MPEYAKPDHRRFVEDMEAAGLEVRHYRGRNFYQGPAVEVDNLLPGRRSNAAGTISGWDSSSTRVDPPGDALQSWKSSNPGNSKVEGGKPLL